MEKLVALIGAFQIALAPTPTIASYSTIHACSQIFDKRIALTFDADMTAGMEALLKTGKVRSWYNRDLIQHLTDYRIPATLFITGMWAETYPSVARALGRNPLFELANHSYSHPGFAQPCYGLEYVSDSQKRYEIYHSQHVISQVTGVEPTLFRFPGGCDTPEDKDLVRSYGMEPILWDIVSGDSFSEDTTHIVRNILDGARDGAIVVAHMNAGPNAAKTADAIREAVPVLRGRGYRFVKVSDLLPKNMLLACR